MPNQCCEYKDDPTSAPFVSLVIANNQTFMGKYFRPDITLIAAAINLALHHLARSKIEITHGPIIRTGCESVTLATMPETHVLFGVPHEARARAGAIIRQAIAPLNRAAAG